MSLLIRRSLIFIVLLLGGLLLYTVWFSIKAERYDDTVIPYLESSIPILTSWQYSQLEPLLSPKARNDFENPALRQAYENFNRLGKFKSMERPQYTNNYDENRETLGVVEVVEYQASLLFDSGPAIIKIKLISDGKSYYIDYFGFQSDVFESSSQE